MIKNFKHIIWDWNGTLLNDIDLSLSIINQILRERGIKELTLAEYRNIFTFPVRDYYERAGLNLSRHSFEELGEEWIREYEKRRLECSLFEGAEETLNMFSGMTEGQSILSAYSQNSLEEVIGYFKLDGYFRHLAGLDHVYADGKINRGKSMIKNLDLDKKEILLIGDTVHDYEVAKELGTECILISGGHQSRERLLACNVPVFNNFADLLSASK